MTNATESYAVTACYRGMRLDRFLQAMAPRMSRSTIQATIEERVQLRSGWRPKASRRLAEGDVVTVHARAPSPVPALAIAVLGETASWVVVDKPAGIATTPTARRPGTDVATRLGLAPAHRLDLGTSGCLLLTRDPATARHFDLAFRSRRVQKEYVAMIEGSPDDDVFSIEAPLGLDTKSRVAHKVAVTAAGTPAATHCEVLQRFPDRTLVRARPLTGRRHQIRVHLAHAGHPIVGDLLYGDDERRFIRHQRGQTVVMPDGLVAGRHLLHAHRLAFPAPGTDERLVFEAAMPADFALDR